MSQEHVAAAQRLRKAVQHLAQRIIQLEIKADDLDIVAKTIEKSTQDLQGEKVPRWWGRKSSNGETRSRSYRSRGIFK